jgi:hypothetical protein
MRIERKLNLANTLFFGTPRSRVLDVAFADEITT